MVPFPDLADSRLGSYHFIYPADSYRHATDSSNIPFDSSRPADSNGGLPDSIRPLVVKLPSSLYFVSRASILQFFTAECYKHVTASSFTPLNSSCQAEPNELPPDSGALLTGELSLFLTILTATDMPPLRAIYHSTRLVQRNLMVNLPDLADSRLESYHSFYPADSNRHATTLSLMPFDSFGPADSNGVLPDPIRPLVVELTSGLYFCSPGKYL